MKQLKLFNLEQPYKKSLTQILNHNQTTLSISSSGGKDSVAMMNYLCRQNYRCHTFCIHADLGLMEWPGTQEYIEETCRERDLELITVRAKKSLFRYILERYRQRKGGVFWMSAKSRYCTSYMKTLPINKYLRRYKTIVNAVGIRSQESTSRAKKSPIRLNRNLCSKYYLDLDVNEAIELHSQNPKGRLAIDWFPIFDWDLDKVWQQLGHSTKEWEQRCKEQNDEIAINGWRYHYAYVVGHGNSRLSCCFCMLGSQGDLRNAIPYNPIAYKFITNLERKTGYSFQSKTFLQKLLEAT